MASKTIVTLIDDLDGKTIEDGGGTVTFSFEGVSYQIDLGDKNLTKFRKVIGPYISAATKVRGTASVSPRRTKAPATAYTQNVRSWARSNGYEVSDRGRVPAAVAKAYADSH